MAQFDFEGGSGPGRSRARDKGETKKGFAMAFGGVFGCLAAVVVIGLAAIGLVVFVFVLPAIRKIDRAAENLNRPPVVGEAPVVPVKAAPADEWITIKPGQPVTVGDIQLTVMAMTAGKVPLKSIGNQFGKSKEVNLRIVFTIDNKSKSRKVDYTTWRDQFRTPATLTDNHDNKYRRVNFGINEIVGSVHDSASIHPGDRMDDILVFELPVKNATSFRLELPGKSVGLKQDFKLRLDRADWENFPLWNDIAD